MGNSYSKSQKSQKRNNVPYLEASDNKPVSRWVMVGGQLKKVSDYAGEGPSKTGTNLSSGAAKNLETSKNLTGYSSTSKITPTADSSTQQDHDQMIDKGADEVKTYTFKNGWGKWENWGTGNQTTLIYKASDVDKNKTADAKIPGNNPEFRAETYSQLRELRDCGLPINLEDLDPETGVYNFKWSDQFDDNHVNKFSLPVRSIDDLPVLGRGAEGVVYDYVLNGQSKKGEPKKYKFAIKKKRINKESANYNYLFFEVILGFAGLEYCSEHAGYFRSGNYLYIVSRNLGLTLTEFSSLVHKHYGYWPNLEVIQLIFSLTSWLFKMHNKFQTCHLDIKPDNIFVVWGTTPSIGDMGISKVMNPADDLNTDLPGCGTIAYLPPEAGWESGGDLNNTETLDFATLMSTTTSHEIKLPKFLLKGKFDIYLLGVSIIQIINNEKIPNRLSRKVEEERRKYYDPELLELIEKMVAYEVEERLDIDQVFKAVLNKIKFYAETKLGMEKYPNAEDFFPLVTARLKVGMLFHDYILSKANEDDSRPAKYDDDVFSPMRKNLGKIENYQHDFDNKAILDIAMTL